MATVEFTDAAAKKVTFTAIVSAASGTVAPTGSVEFFDGATSLGTGNSADSTGVGTSTWTIATSSLVAGTHSNIFAVYTATGSFTGSTAVGITQIVDRLQITGDFTANNKVYDGNTSATVATRFTVGVVSGDKVNLAGGTASFASETVGTNKLVTLVGAFLTGADSGNYVLGSVDTATADITALHITGDFTAANKVYNGNTSATVATRFTMGTVGGDAVSLTGGTAAFDTANAGTVKLVTLVGAELSGIDAGNYVLDSVDTATADITKANQTIAWATPAAITYGDLLSGSELNATVEGVSGGSTPGALIYSPAAGTVLLAGNHTLMVTAAATQNYW